MIINDGASYICRKALCYWFFYFEIIPNGEIDFYYQDFFNLDFSICTKSNRHQCSGYKLSKLDRVILIKYIIFDRKIQLSAYDDLVLVNTLLVKNR